MHTRDVTKTETNKKYYLCVSQLPGTWKSYHVAVVATTTGKSPFSIRKTKSQYVVYDSELRGRIYMGKTKRCKMANEMAYALNASPKKPVVFKRTLEYDLVKNFDLLDQVEVL